MTTEKGGRPDKFTKENVEKLLVAIRKGAPYDMACNYAGISYCLFREWVLRAEAKKDESYVQFLKDLKEAEGHTALIWLDKIDKAMNEGVWQAAAWKLERRHFKHFSSQTAVIELSDDIEKLKEDRKKGLDNGKTNNRKTKENT